MNERDVAPGHYLLDLIDGSFGLGSCPSSEEYLLGVVLRQLHNRLFVAYMYRSMSAG